MKIFPPRRSENLAQSLLLQFVQVKGHAGSKGGYYKKQGIDENTWMTF